MAKADLQGADNNLAKAGLKLDNGILSQADYLRFQAGKAGKELALQQAQTALQISLQDFANYLGASELLMPSALNLENEQDLIAILGSYDQSQTRRLTDTALQMLAGRNLNLQMLDKSVELSERAYRIAKASFLPTVMLTGSRKYSENGIDRYDFEASNQLILSASLPILPGWGNYAATRKAREEARQMKLEALSAMDGIRLGVQSAVLHLVGKARQVQSTGLTLSYTEQLYAQLTERFNLNMISASELLDAELMLSGARIANTGARYDYLNARRNLMRALVLDDNRELEQLIIQ
ncbi:MAG: TolC family protein [Candidatus Cloacimonetes bacterium]|nr:TolC family protein [Candidatus Cloacimonadota bacterium]